MFDLGLAHGEVSRRTARWNAFQVRFRVRWQAPRVSRSSEHSASAVPRGNASIGQFQERRGIFVSNVSEGGRS